MLRSLLEYINKPRGHEEAEKELAEIVDQCLYLTEDEKSEIKTEYDRLQHEIHLYNAGKSTAELRNVDVVLRDSRALKYRIKKMINDRKVAAVRAGLAVSESTSAGADHRNVPQEANIISPSVPPDREVSRTTSSHTNEATDTGTNISLSIPSAGEAFSINEGQLERQSSASSNPNSTIPERHPISAQVNSTQAVSLARSGMSYQLDSMIIEGASVKFATMNIDSPGSTGAFLSYGSQVIQSPPPQPPRPRRAISRRMQRQPSNFKSSLSGVYVSNGSIICSNSRVTGATLNVNSVNSCGPAFRSHAQERA